jgi:acetoin utilization deacetylase AcuC-like enzyme
MWEPCRRFNDPAELLQGGAHRSEDVPHITRAMHVVYSPRYHVDIGTHVFPTIKYHLLYDRLDRLGYLTPSEVIEPEPAAWEDLALVHTSEYLDKVRGGSFSVSELAQLEMPWSPSIVEGFRLMTGGTLRAAEAVRPGSGGPPLMTHLGGGFHHAFANHGEGFCLFNDVALAIRVLQARHGVRRAAVIDCDVHHGNGTAFIFNPGGVTARQGSIHDGEGSVFTFSIHQEHNYPVFKPRGSLDIGLRDGAGDLEYLNALAGALPSIMAFEPEVAFYLAGADPFHDDQLGGLSLTFEGLRERDRMVIAACRSAGVPTVVTLAGGYARKVHDTVRIHLATVEEVRRGLT